MAKLAGGGPGEPVRVQYRRFGDLAAVWSVLTRIGVAEIIDEVVPRRSDAAASVGTYIALACANRVVAPCSKLAFADWWAGTAGPRWLKTAGQALDHRRFWDATDLLDAAALKRIETELGRRIAAEYQLDLSALVLDMTNFACRGRVADRSTVAVRTKRRSRHRRAGRRSFTRYEHLLGTATASSIPLERLRNEVADAHRDYQSAHYRRLIAKARGTHPRQRHPAS